MRGQADFGMYAPKSVGASLSDMADLAVRLGSIVEYDRRGDVIYLDDFTAPAPKFLESVATGSSVKLNSEAFVSGGQAVKIVTAGGVNDHAIMEHHIAPLVSGKHGSKIAITLVSMLEDTCWFLIQLGIFDGVYSNTIGVRINPYAETLEYFNDAFDYTVFETDFRASSPKKEYFHNMKLVYDLDTGKYVRFLFDIYEWDMSAYNFYRTSNTRYPLHIVRHYFNPTSAYAFGIWLDNFVYTINEP